MNLSSLRQCGLVALALCMCAGRMWADQSDATSSDSSSANKIQALQSNGDEGWLVHITQEQKEAKAKQQAIDLKKKQEQTALDRQKADQDKNKDSDSLKSNPISDQTILKYRPSVTPFSSGTVSQPKTTTSSVTPMVSSTWDNPVIETSPIKSFDVLADKKPVENKPNASTYNSSDYLALQRQSLLVPQAPEMKNLAPNAPGRLTVKTPQAPTPVTTAEADPTPFAKPGLYKSRIQDPSEYFQR